MQRVRAPSSFTISRHAAGDPVANDDRRSCADHLSVGEQGQSLRGTVARQFGREHQAGSSQEVPVRRRACSPLEPPVSDHVRIGSQGSDQLPACETDVDPMDLSPLGKGKGGKKGKSKGKGDKTTKPRECFYCGKPGHSKSECRNFSAALKKKAV